MPKVAIAVVLALAGCADLQQATIEATGDGGLEESSGGSGDAKGTGLTGADTTGGVATTGSLGSTSALDGDETSGDGSSSGEPAPSCWDADPSAWVVEPLDTSGLASGSLRSAALSADALRLVYATESMGLTTAYFAERMQPTDAFAGQAQVATWANDVPNLGVVRFVGTGGLSMMYDAAILSTVFDGAAWPSPVPVLFETPPVAPIGSPHLYDDGRSIVVDIADGAAVQGTATPVPYEAHRANVDEPFGALERITIADWGRDVPVLCPIASPAGDHLLFGGADPVVWTDPVDVLIGALDVFYARRDEADAWVDPVRITVASHDVRLACPTSVSDDGCSMIVRWWSVQDDALQFVHATR